MDFCKEALEENVNYEALLFQSSLLLIKCMNASIFTDATIGL
jgi:hypothetical protein